MSYSANKRVRQIIAIIVLFGGFAYGVYLFNEAKNEADNIYGIIVIGIGIGIAIIFFKWANDY